MVKGTAAKVVRFLAPLVYRECPMGNAHVRWDLQCSCCRGNEFTYFRGAWRPSRWVDWKGGPGSSSLSWSGQLSGSELWLGALKQGAILGLAAMLVAVWLGAQTKEASESAAAGMRRQQATQQEE